MQSMRIVAYFLSIVASCLPAQDASHGELGYISDNQGEVFVLTYLQGELSAMRVGTFFETEPLTRKYISVIALDGLRKDFLGFGIASYSRWDPRSGKSSQTLCSWLESVSSAPQFSPNGKLLAADVTYVEGMVPPIKNPSQIDYRTDSGFIVIDAQTLLPMRFFPKVGKNSFFTPDSSAIVGQSFGENRSLRYDLQTSDFKEFWGTDEGYFESVRWLDSKALVFLGIPAEGPGASMTRCILLDDDGTSHILGEYQGERLQNFDHDTHVNEAFYDSESKVVTVVKQLLDKKQSTTFTAGLFENMHEDVFEQSWIPSPDKDLIVFKSFKYPANTPWTDGYLLPDGKVLFCLNPGTRHSAHLQLLDTESGKWSKLVTFGTGGATNFVEVPEPHTSE